MLVVHGPAMPVDYFVAASRTACRLIHESDAPATTLVVPQAIQTVHPVARV